jgi:hypothetical protein
VFFEKPTILAASVSLRRRSVGGVLVDIFVPRRSAFGADIFARNADVKQGLEFRKKWGPLFDRENEVSKKKQYSTG